MFRPETLPSDRLVAGMRLVGSLFATANRTDCLDPADVLNAENGRRQERELVLLVINSGNVLPRSDKGVPWFAGLTICQRRRAKHAARHRGGFWQAL